MRVGPTVYGISEASMRFLRRISAGSNPRSAAARSNIRSLMKAASKKPGAR